MFGPGLTSRVFPAEIRQLRLLGRRLSTDDAGNVCRVEAGLPTISLSAAGASLANIEYYNLNITTRERQTVITPGGSFSVRCGCHLKFRLKSACQISILITT